MTKTKKDGSSVEDRPFLKKSKVQPPARKLAFVLLALLDHIAIEEFGNDDGELWNECKGLVEEVLRGSS